MTLAVSRKCRLSVVLLILSLPVPAIASDTLPAGDDVNDAAKKASQISDSFFSQTFKIRMRYEYAGGLADPNDKMTIRALATKASDDLEQIANDQDALKKQIEDYEGDDWESRFGETGVWRKLAADLQKTQISKLEIDYYIARVDGKFQSQAEQQFFKLRAKSDLSQCESLKSSLEQIKRFGPSEPNELNNLAEQIAQTDCKSDREIVMQLGCLQHRFAPQSLGKTVQLFPFIRDDIGKLILDDLQSRYKQDGLADVNSLPLTAFEAELAAQAARGDHFAGSADIIRRLSGADKFRTPRILFIAAMSVVDTSPAEAVRLLVDASRLSQSARDSDASAGELATQAVGLARKLLTGTADHCPLVCEAFENYLSIAEANSDPNFGEIESLYASALYFCGKSDQSRRLLEKIVAGPEGGRRKPGEAINLYCQLLLDDANLQSAQKVLDILDNVEAPVASNVEAESRYDFFRAEALRQSGRLEESAGFMSRAIDTNDNSIAPQAVALLSEVLDKAEIWEQQADDFNEMLKNCERLARFARKSINDQQTALTLAEVTILRDNPDFAHTLLDSLADKNDTNRIRPQARFLTAQGDFSQAALLWAKIAELRRNESPTPNQKSWNWWRAKFYELACLGKLPATNAGDLRHTIEVLQNSYSEIPRPWAEKLAALKEQLQNND